jgi:hypothetical protein
MGPVHGGPTEADAKGIDDRHIDWIGLPEALPEVRADSAALAQKSDK